MKTTTIELKAADGFAPSAYLATPEAPRAGLVVLQEIFGVNGHIRHLCDDFASKGYAAVAPALFDRAERGVDIGYTSPDVQRGLALRGQISDENALSDVAAAIEYLSPIGPVGVVGYCWGGLVAWLSVTRLQGVAAAACYYAGGIGKYAAETPKAPVILHFGERDHAIPLTEVSAVKSAHPNLPVHLYDAGHGFSCNARPSFDPAAAAQANARTDEFLARHVLQHGAGG